MTTRREMLVSVVGRIGVGLASVLVAAGCQAPAVNEGRQTAAALTAVHAVDAPTVDGRLDDQAWQGAATLQVVAASMRASTEVELRAVRTPTHLYLGVRWRDASHDARAHKPWVWDAAAGRYVEGVDREDMCSVAFEHTGPFDADMLSGVPATWDVWHWKAVRTDPVGFAMDRAHRYTPEKPEGKAHTYLARNGRPVWIARPEDRGDTVERKQPAPDAQGATVVPQYVPATPTGSAADVRARGTWEAGWWTVEFERRLDTGDADDTAFVPGGTCRMAIGIHDRTGDMDKATGVVELRLESAAAQKEER